MGGYGVLSKLLLLLLLLLFVGTGVQAAEASLEFIESLGACEGDSENIVRLKRALEASFDRVKKEQKVVSWEMEDRRNRTPHYCIEQCACLTTEYAIDLKKQFKEDRFTIQRLRLTGGPGILPVELAVGSSIYSYRYHVALLIHDLMDDCAIFIDPILLQKAERNQPLTPKAWTSKVKSLKENSIFLNTL